MNDTSYELSVRQIEELFADYLQGDKSPLLCVLSFSGLGAAAKEALRNSANVLGYESSCAFVRITASLESDVAPQAKAAGVGSGEMPPLEAGIGEAPSSSDVPPLDARSLFMLLEGLDPRCVVASDAAAARLFCEAYRSQLFFGEGRVFGRSVLLFEDFAAELSDEARRQRAWALLKRLPALNTASSSSGKKPAKAKLR